MNIDYATDLSEQPSQEPALDLPASLRLACVLLTMFALLNVARESTYMIGAIQHYGAPRLRDYEGVISSVLSLVLGGMAAGIRRGSIKSWWAAIVGGSFFILKLWAELAYALNYRARGGTDADVQIVLFIFAIVMLIGAVLFLLAPPSVKMFWSTRTNRRTDSTIYDAPSH